MKDNLTEIVCIIDSSGSMWPLKNDTIGGFNNLINEQKNIPGEARLTTILFNSTEEVVHDHVDLQSVPAMTTEDYRPAGMTALMDAVGRAINRVGKRLSDTPEDERPAHVLFVIITDGEENASTEFNGTQVKKMIEHQKSKYSWEFVFIGAGIDAYAGAKAMGVQSDRALSASADAIGLKNIYTSVSNIATAVRTDCLAKEEWKVGDLGEYYTVG